MAAASVHDLQHRPSKTPKPTHGSTALVATVRETLTRLDADDLAGALADLHAALGDGHVRLRTLLTARREADDELLDIRQVAQLIGRSRSWLEHHPHALPGRRQAARGNKCLWSRRAVLAWLKALEKAA